MSTPGYRTSDEFRSPTPEVEQIITAAREGVTPHQLINGGIYAVLVNGNLELLETPGFQDEHADERADKPRMVKRDVTMLDVASFLDYLGRYSALGTYAQAPGELEVWADIDARKVTGILDGLNGWRQHTVTLKLQHSREWNEWSAIDGNLLGQVEFAEFIEDHLSTIAAPDGAQLLDICQTLQVHTGASFKQQNILATGQRVFRYEEDVEAKAGARGDLTVPGELTLVLRPFQGGEPVAMTARFRFQVREGVLRLGVKLAEPDKALEDAFGAVVAEVQSGVPVHVNAGRP